MSLQLSGIYQIINTLNQKRYVGSSVNIKNRWKVHRYAFIQGKNSRYLQTVWDKYGEENFKFEVVEYCSTDILLQREQYWMDYFQSYNSEKGYNICPKAGSVFGRKLSDEHKRKIGLAFLGRKYLKKRKFSDEHRKKLSEALKGKSHSVSEETRQKIRLNKLGKKASEETKRKQSLAQLGKHSVERKISPQQKLKLSERMKNNTFFKGKKHSESSKEKLRSVRKGSKHTEETKNKISKALLGNNWNMGKKLSEETKEKMRISHKNRLMHFPIESTI